MTSRSQLLETSKNYEPGIEDVTVGILNDTSDDFVCSIINSVDMSMTIVSDGDGDRTLTTEPLTRERFITAESEVVAVPDVYDDITTNKGSVAAEEPRVSHLTIPQGPSSDGVWKKFRITSPFSVKPQPTVQIRLVNSSSLPAPSSCSVAAAEVQTSPYCTFPKGSMPCMSQASSAVSLAASLKDSTLPFSSDGESGQDDAESFQQPSLATSFPTNIPSFKTLFNGKKESIRDPMKKIKGTKIRKATIKKKKQNSSQHWKSHLGNLVERLRSVGIEYDTSYFDHMSPERPPKRLVNNSPEPEIITNRKGNRECLQKSSKIPRPVDSLSQVKISTLQDVSSFRRKTQSAGLRCSEVQQNKDAIRLRIGREISQIRDLSGVPKVRKLESFAKQYLRHVDNETFEWAIAQLSGTVYPEFIKAEEDYRRIKELVTENPTFKTGDASDPWWTLSQTKIKEIEEGGYPSLR